MPCSPRSRIPSGLRRPTKFASPPGQVDTAFARLDRSNDGQDHTVLPYAIGAVRRTLPRAHGVRLNPPPALPSTLRADAVCVHRTSPTYRTTRDPPLGPGEMQEGIR